MTADDERRAPGAEGEAATTPEPTSTAALQAEVERSLGRELASEVKRAATQDLLFRRLVESVSDYAIFMLDAGGRVASWNIGAQRIKGYRADEILGSHFSRFYPVEDVEAGKCDMELEVAARDGRFEDEGWRVRKDGSRFWANVVISAMRGDDGGLIGFSKVTRDLTARRRAEEDRAARLVAEESNRAKDEFLAMLGHELRNPLAPILTALQLMQMRSGGQPSREHEIIDRQVRHMMRLVEDLLDVSRIARGAIELHRRRIGLLETLTAAIEQASPLFEQRRHHLAIDVAEAMAVDGDPARLTQVFGNLLVNAAKYTPPGGHIKVRLARDGEHAVVVVEDDGSGIEAHVLPHIFDLFFQARQNLDRAAGGLGIGLRLVRSLVELHGGTVEARSDGPGRGSTFVVRLPLAKASTKEPSGENPRPLPRMQTARVLLVDDNEDALVLMGQALRAAGHDVVTAGDGPQALARLLTFKPDVAILDIGLPVMDGFELAGRLRETLGADPWIVAVTGYGQDHDRKRSAAAGFDEHLVKPVSVQALLESIGRRR